LAFTDGPPPAEEDWALIRRPGRARWQAPRHENPAAERVRGGLRVQKKLPSLAQNRAIRLRLL
jgi:hypothetical protein